MIDVEAKGLTIGGYESAFFADLVAAWVLENTVELMLDTTFDGIYATMASLSSIKSRLLMKFVIGWKHSKRKSRTYRLRTFTIHC
jgi:hypothetical protein